MVSRPTNEANYPSAAAYLFDMGRRETKLCIMRLSMTDTLSRAFTFLMNPWWLLSCAETAFTKCVTYCTTTSYALTKSPVTLPKRSKSNKHRQLQIKKTTYDISGGRGEKEKTRKQKWFQILQFIFSLKRYQLQEQ